MGDAGFGHFPGGLDPYAAEFRPTTLLHNQTAPQQQQQQHLFFPPPYPTPPFLPYAHLITTSPPSYVTPVPFPNNVTDSHFNSHIMHFNSPPPQPHFITINSPPQPHFNSNININSRTESFSVPSEATRTLLLTHVPRGASETEVRRELEAFGDVRAVQMERVRREGIATVHFYDVRQAVMAAREIHMQRNKREARGGVVVVGGGVCAQFVVPNMAGLPDGYNQGTLVVFHLTPDFNNNTLLHLFSPFGDVKELRDTPTKRHQRFVEFYDVRDAAKAYSQLKGKEIFGNKLVIEFSRPGWYKKQSQKNISKNPNTQDQNQPHSPLITRQNSYNSQARKPSSQGSTNGSEKCSPKENLKKGNQVSSGNSKNTSKNKGWSHRARQRRCLDSRFLINEDGIVDSNVSDSRTTVMIKNIPNKYSQKLLMNMLDNHCIHCNDEIASNGRDEPLSSYDFVYLPIDFMNKCNVGYGFVNMTSPVAALRLYKAFHQQTWEVYNSKKICDVTYARLQGLEALKEHFRNSKFPCTTDEYLPVVFSPPRDGRQITNPLPVVRAHSLSPSNNKEEDKSTSSHQTLTDDDLSVGDGGDSSQ